jgi:hypothetical protein
MLSAANDKGHIGPASSSGHSPTKPLRLPSYRRATGYGRSSASLRPFG